MNTEFSIVIPSYNRARQLEITLNAISENLKNFTQLPIEIIVILDGSTDESEEMLSRTIDSFPVPLRYKWQVNHGLATTRNRLIQMARGRIVWLLDDDMIITQNAIRSHFINQRVENSILTGSFSITGSKRIQLFYEERWNRLNANSTIRSPCDMSFANTSFQRELLLEHPFNEEFKTYGFEDYELTARLLKQGIVIEYSNDALVAHNYHKSDFSVLQDKYHEGENRVLFANLHPEHKLIAYDLQPRKLRRSLTAISNLRMHRTIWIAAVLLFAISRFAGERFLLLSLGLAVHAGFTKAGGKLE